MAACPHCKRKMPYGCKQCPYCKRPAIKQAERKIPIATAVIAIAFFSLMVFGTATLIISRLDDRAYGDEGLHLNGTWEIASLTFNDEFITYVFSGDSFTSTTETIVFDANQADIQSIREFHQNHSGAALYAENIGSGNYRLSILSSGTFSLDGNSILLIMDNNMPQLLPFYWEGEAIIINGDRFLRQ